MSDLSQHLPALLDERFEAPTKFSIVHTGNERVKSGTRLAAEKDIEGRQETRQHRVGQSALDLTRRCDILVPTLGLDGT